MTTLIICIVGERVFPKGVVLDNVNGEVYRIVGIYKDKYLLESEKKGDDGKKDKKMVNVNDPHNRYVPKGFYK
ncbi:hypothetical protein LCGC14_0245530 [marine sediment metagenome]|uniref:DUF1653 domain-containing protein n=1 Tax=marine sediment metagenome TaxID=412755 RepID=A0A0F9UMC2_9ZZZZ